MNKHDVLQKIPYDQEFNYEDTKGSIIDDFNYFFKYGANAIQSVNNSFEDHYIDMDENGMTKFVCMVIGMLFQIEHNQVEKDLAYGTAYDINDFENGDYEDLFTPGDLKLFKDDIEIVKKWLNEHKEYWQD